MAFSIPVAVGSGTLIVTTVFIIFQGITAAYIEDAAPVRISSLVSVVLQAVVAIVTTTLCLDKGTQSGATQAQIRRQLHHKFAIGLVLVLSAVATSTMALLLLSKSPVSTNDSIMGISRQTMLVTSGALLGFAFGCQLIFLTSFLLNGRKCLLDRAASIFASDIQLPCKSSSTLKVVPYSHTTPDTEQGLETKAEGSCPSLTASLSVKSGVASTVGSVSSRTRLLSKKEKRRPDSLDWVPSYSRENSFDSWDTSSVDNFTRQTVLDVSTQPKRPFLETIPASPLSSHGPSPSPGPGNNFDLPLPQPVRSRSRSYSPASSRRISIGSNANPSEAHIHPLFRSDSTEPPPVATPGTTVLASPVAGQIIPARSSVKSLSRMRSGSASQTPSPLSRQSSFENDGRATTDVTEEMPPPIPDWITSAGERSSYHDYTRRTLSGDGSRM